jgi:PhnB protein
MATVNVYLNFDGNCEEAFNFYKSVFGGEFPYLGRYKDMPVQEDAEFCSPASGEKIMHISLAISKETMIMGCDIGGEWVSTFQKGNNFSISITAENKDEADRLFNGLSEEGTITMPMQNTFWGDYFGMFTDRFGISWMVSFATGEHQ